LIPLQVARQRTFTISEPAGPRPKLRLAGHR
jgi:hypothetical protein